MPRVLLLGLQSQELGSEGQGGDLVMISGLDNPPSCSSCTSCGRLVIAPEVKRSQRTTTRSRNQGTTTSDPTVALVKQLQPKGHLWLQVRHALQEPRTRSIRLYGAWTVVCCIGMPAVHPTIGRAPLTDSGLTSQVHSRLSTLCCNFRA